MNRGRRAIVVVLLLAVSAAAVFVGIRGIGSGADPAAAYTTETVRQGSVAKTVSASGNLVDAYVYAIAPKTTPVLIEQAGVKVGNAAAAQGYRTTDLLVKPGDKVDKNEKLAVVKDTNDKKKKVKAPFSGVIRTVTTAEKASASQVATLAVGQQLVSVQVSEYDVAKVKKKQQVTLSLSSSSRQISGTVSSIGQTADEASGVQKYQVLIKSDDLPSTAKVGMSVTATIKIAAKSNVLSVDAASVTTTGGASTVRVLNAQGAVAVTKVKVGLVGDRDVEITSGLKAGDVVVTGASGTVPATSGGGFGPGAGS